LLDLDNFSCITEANQEFTSQIDIEYPDLSNNNEEIINIDVIIKRENIIEEILSLYKNEIIVQKKNESCF